MVLSSLERKSGFSPVTSRAWWSVTLPSSTLRRVGVAFAPHLVFPFGLCADEGEQFGNFGKHVFGDVAASRSRIGYQLLLVEFLRDFKRLFRREAVLGVGFFLERGQVVQQGSFLRLLLALCFRYRGAACRLYLIVSAPLPVLSSFHFSEDANFTTSPSQPSVAIWSCQNASDVKRRFSSSVHTPSPALVSAHAPRNTCHVRRRWITPQCR